MVMHAPRSAFSHPARWWRMREDGRIECFLCPRRCKLREGQRGFCAIRRRVGDGVELEAYGRTSGFAVDPVEKKPLYHFLPNSTVLSFGTAGCNLACQFCQNWDISTAAGLARLHERALPEAVVARAQHERCASVAFTYNEPTISAEFVIDVARACHAAGINTIAVTAGYISPEARPEFFEVMDAANIDLKAFNDAFYHRLCAGALQPVLETLVYVRHHTTVWLEVTTLLIPGENDDPAEIERAAEWFVSELGPDVPWHFTAYHPDFKLTAPPTPRETLERARAIARGKGIRHVYLGNLPHGAATSTWCPDCDGLLIERSAFGVQAYHLDGSRCRFCGTGIPGRFDRVPDIWRWGQEPIRVSTR